MLFEFAKTPTRQFKHGCQITVHHDYINNASVPSIHFHSRESHRLTRHLIYRKAASDFLFLILDFLAITTKSGKITLQQMIGGETQLYTYKLFGCSNFSLKQLELVSKPAHVF